MRHVYIERNEENVELIELLGWNQSV